MAVTDKQTLAASSGSNPAAEATAITPADTDLAQFTRAIYVGGAGDLAVKMGGKDNIVVFKDVPAGSLLPIRVSQIRATLTTATNIVELY